MRKNSYAGFLVAGALFIAGVLTCLYGWADSAAPPPAGNMTPNMRLEAIGALLIFFSFAALMLAVLVAAFGRSGGRGRREQDPRARARHRDYAIMAALAGADLGLRGLNAHQERVNRERAAHMAAMSELNRQMAVTLRPEAEVFSPDARNLLAETASRRGAR